MIKAHRGGATLCISIISPFEGMIVGYQGDESRACLRQEEDSIRY
jgi:hypothetical protein